MPELRFPRVGDILEITKDDEKVDVEVTSHEGIYHLFVVKQPRPEGDLYASLCCNKYGKYYLITEFQSLEEMQGSWKGDS